MAMVGLDLDNILADFVETFLEFLRQRTGHRYHADEIIDYSLQKALGIPAEAMDRIFDDFNRLDKWAEIPLITAARDFFHQLKQQGHAVVVVTSRPAASETATRRWFVENEIPVDDVLIADGIAKSRVIEKSGYRFEYFVDDGLHFAEDISRVVKPVYLLTCPWNARFAGRNKNIVRIKRLHDIFRDQELRLSPYLGRHRGLPLQCFP